MTRQFSFSHLLIYFLTCLLLPDSLSAQQDSSQTYTPSTVPNPVQQGSWVSDPAGYLTFDEQGAIDAVINGIADSTTVEIAVVILPGIGRENPKDFATQLFNIWKIGKAGTDNGLLILSVMDQRRTEFETGSGLEAVLPDILCYRIGMQQLVPSFQEGRYAEGILNTLDAFRKLIEDPDARQDLVSDPPAPGSLTWSIPFTLPLIYLLLLLGFHLYLAGSVGRIFRQPGDLHDKYLALRRWKLLVWVFIFPIPYIGIYLWLGKRLKQLRNQPRFGPKTGAPLRLLTEEEEDEHLDRGQVAEENLGSVDYDVWVAPEGKEVLVLRYASRFSKYKSCPSCGYTTYHHTQTNTLVPATTASAGMGEKVYSCKNCGYENRETYTIPRHTSGSSRSGGSSSSGGSWGGGSSSGGGGGVSW